MSKKIWFIAGLGLVLRLFLYKYLTYYPDLYTYQDWSLTAIRYGFGQFYDRAICDYLPGYVYILWLVGKIYYFVNAKIGYLPVELAYKLPAILADVFASLLIYKIIKKNDTESRAVLGAGLYLFNPLVIANSTLWGQTDGLVMAGLVIMAYGVISRKPTWAGVALGMAQLIKPIAILVLPFWLIYTLSKKWTKTEISRLFLSCVMTFVVGFVPFTNQNNLLEFVWSRLSFTTGFWSLTSLNALNFWGLHSMLLYGKIDQVSSQTVFLGLTYKVWGWLVFVTSYLWAIYKTWVWEKQEKLSEQRVFLLLSGMYLAMFWCLTGMHERHVFLAVGWWSIVSALGNKKYGYISVVMTLVGVLNLILAYQAANIVDWSFAWGSIFLLCMAGGVALTKWLAELNKS